MCQWIMKFSEIPWYCLKTYQKEKRNFIYPCTDNFKTRNFGTLSVDYIKHTDICIAAFVSWNAGKVPNSSTSAGGTKELTSR